MKFCAKDGYYLYLDAGTVGGGAQSMSDTKTLNRICRRCGYTEKDSDGGLITETYLQQRASEGYKILLNEFTRQDQTLPHIKTIKCPKETCPTNTGGVEKDVIYMKYDSAALKYIYICNVCSTQWRSRTD